MAVLLLAIMEVHRRGWGILLIQGMVHPSHQEVHEIQGIHTTQHKAPCLMSTMPLAMMRVLHLVHRHLVHRQVHEIIPRG